MIKFCFDLSKFTLIGYTTHKNKNLKPHLALLKRKSYAQFGEILWSKLPRVFSRYKDDEGNIEIKATSDGLKITSNIWGCIKKKC